MIFNSLMNNINLMQYSNSTVMNDMSIEKLEFELKNIENYLKRYINKKINFKKDFFKKYFPEIKNYELYSVLIPEKYYESLNNVNLPEWIHFDKFINEIIVIKH